jgi:hypothetical protein
MERNTKSKLNKRPRSPHNNSSEDEANPQAVSEENYDDDEKEYDFGNNEEIKSKGIEKNKKRLKKTKKGDSDSNNDKKKRLKKGGFKDAANEDGNEVFLDENESPSGNDSDIDVLFGDQKSEKESQEMTME